MGFMGSLTLPFLTFIFPATFWYKLHGRRQGMVAALAVGAVTVSGVLGLVAGFTSNLVIAMRVEEGRNATAV